MSWEKLTRRILLPTWWYSRTRGNSTRVSQTRAYRRTWSGTYSRESCSYPRICPFRWNNNFWFLVRDQQRFGLLECWYLKVFTWVWTYWSWILWWKLRARRNCSTRKHLGAYTWMEWKSVRVCTEYLIPYFSRVCPKNSLIWLMKIISQRVKWNFVQKYITKKKIGIVRWVFGLWIINENFSVSNARGERIEILGCGNHISVDMWKLAKQTWKQFMKNFLKKLASIFARPLSSQFL